MGRVVGWIGALVLVSAIARAEVGSHELSEDELQGEMARNTALAAYVDRNGPPTLAESHLLADRPPWDSYEITLYYLDLRKEIGFARALILGRPEIHLVRYERPMSEEDAAALAGRPGPRGLGPDERAEAAAQRAESAAGHVEAAAASTERAADRAEWASAEMERAFHRALRK